MVYKQIFTTEWPEYGLNSLAIYRLSVEYPNIYKFYLFIKKKT